MKCTPGRALVRHRPMTASSDELIRNLIQGRSQTRRSRSKTIYSAGVTTSAREAEAAKAVIKALTAPSAAAVYKARGLDPAW